MKALGALENTLTCKGSDGGIVKQSKDCKPQAQPTGSGMTVYYLVEDLEKVKYWGRGISQSCLLI